MQRVAGNVYKRQQRSQGNARCRSSKYGLSPPPRVTIRYNVASQACRSVIRGSTCKTSAYALLRPGITSDVLPRHGYVTTPGVAKSTCRYRPTPRRCMSAIGSTKVVTSRTQPDVPARSCEEVSSAEGHVMRREEYSVNERWQVRCQEPRVVRTERSKWSFARRRTAALYVVQQRQRQVCKFARHMRTRTIAIPVAVFMGEQRDKYHGQVCHDV